MGVGYQQTIERIQVYLTDADRRPRYRGHPNILVGQCYVACEVMRTLHPELRPQVMTVNGNGEEGLPQATHWFLRDPLGEVVDPTAEQFPSEPRYSEGRGCGFLTKAPSARARSVLERMGHETSV